MDGEITKEEFAPKHEELIIDKAKLTQKLEQNTAVLSTGEEDLEQALTMANNFTRLWGSADEEHRHQLLQTLFVKFVVDQQRIVDMELKPPYSWLLRLIPERAEVVENEGVSEGVSDDVGVVVSVES